MTDAAQETIIDEFNRNVAEIPDKPAMRTRDAHGNFTDVLTWGQYGAKVRAVAAALRAEGVGRGDGAGILSGNRAEYHIADVATLATGAVAVPVYSSNSPEQVQYVLENGDAKVCFVENAEQAAKVAKVREHLPSLKKVITFTDGEADLTWAELVTEGEKLPEAEPAAYAEMCAQIKGDDLACLIYTSGTTGPPKGVMLSHHNVAWTGEKIVEVLHADPYRVLSYLPLAHIAERLVSHYGCIQLGGETWFAGSIDTLRDDIGACRPTLFFAVPRVYEKFEAAIRQRLAETPGLKGTLARKAQEVGERVARAEQAGLSANPLDSILNNILSKVVLEKLHAQVGFDKVQIMATGAAPITDDTMFFFMSLGLGINEVYGQSEGTGPTTLTPVGGIKIGSVGTAVPGVEIKIDDDGEICFRGENVFVGYYKNEEATKETLDADGFLHSGDLGELGSDGYLKITGRKKDLIITAGGKNISPQNIESMLKSNPLISQAVAIGDKRKFMSALITIDEEAIAAWAEANGKDDDVAALVACDEVKKIVDDAVAATNEKLSHVEQVKKFTILPKDLTQEAGEMTPTLKVKRNVVTERYADHIDKMYE